MPNILLVEDEEIISEPLALVLRAHAYPVDVASNGFEAGEYCQQKNYDLILLDIMMPICDGVEFLKKAELKLSSPRTRVVLLTNLSGGKEISEALALGAHKSILKASITPHLLIELVQAELPGTKKATRESHS